MKGTHLYGAANIEVVNGSHNNIRRSHVNTDPQEYVTKLVNICLQSLFSLRAFCTVRVLIFDAPSGEIHAVGDFRAPEQEEDSTEYYALKSYAEKKERTK